MKSILGFDYLLTPRVLVLLDRHAAYFAGGVYTMFSDHLITGFIGTICSLVGCRVMFELIMVAFKNNEYLRRIAENTSVKSAE
jgi:hypothetical protein